MKKGNRITSAQVAAYAGVSQSAVSRVFTPGASVSPVMKKRVEEAAKLLGYRPNAIARSLITSQSKIIAVVMAYLDNLFYPSMLEELSRLLSERDYHLLLFTGMKDQDSDVVFEQLMQYQVDGIILTSTALSSALSAECTAAGIPVVLINRTNDSELVSSVTSDNFLGGYQVADYLLAGGHQRFAYIAGVEQSSTNRDRLRGYRTRLSEANIYQISIAEGNYSREGAQQAIRQLMQLAVKPDAIFVANDHMAVAVIDVIRYEFGLKIPEQVSVVGYDNVGPACWPAYDITSVEQPVEEMAKAAVDILWQQFEQQSVQPSQKVIAGNLVVRSSAKKPQQGILRLNGSDIYAPAVK